MNKKEEQPLTKKNIEKWREQVKDMRHELFHDMKFDKFGRLIKDIL